MTASKLIAPDFITTAAQGQNSLLVIVVGAGGTGSALLGKLFQLDSTVRKLGGAPLDVVVFDDDTVSPSNIGRQSFYPFDIGRPKAEVLVERFNQLGETQWGYVPEKFTSEHAESARSYRHSGVVIFGCVDNASGRKEMHKALNGRQNIVYVDAGNANRSGNVVVGVNAQINRNDVYYPSVYDLYKTQLDEWLPVLGDSCSHEESIQRQDFGLNDSMALYASQVLWQMLRHGECAYHSLTVDLESGQVSPVGVDPDYWSMFGYVQNNEGVNQVA